MASQTDYELVIVGGGAAGFFAAISAVEYAAAAGLPSPRILILEKSHRPLAKVLISGGGRCNVTHACYEPAELVRNYPRGDKALRGVFSRFQPRDIVAWFENRGVPLKTEADGRIFPASDSAQTITDCLLQAAREAGAELWLQANPLAIEQAGSLSPPFRITLSLLGEGGQKETRIITAQSLLLASGGAPAGMQLARSLGHTITPLAPSLFTFNIPDPRLADLEGISVDHAGLSLLDSAGKPVSLPGFAQTGSVLVTHWGLSGPAVLRLSAWAARWLFERSYRAGFRINWLSPRTWEQVTQELLALKNKPARARQKAYVKPLYPEIPRRLWERLVQSAGIPENANWADLSKSSLQALAAQLTRSDYTVTGKGVFKEEFVTCGGVSLDEVDFKTMQSRLVPGLFFAGEILDIDGLTGGFNFQNAWSTAWLAGRGAADFINAQ